MQEEVNGKVVARVIDGAKMNEQVLEITSLRLLRDTHEIKVSRNFKGRVQQVVSKQKS